MFARSFFAYEYATSMENARESMHIQLLVSPRKSRKRELSLGLFCTNSAQNLAAPESSQISDNFDDFRCIRKILFFGHFRVKKTLNAGPKFGLCLGTVGGPRNACVAYFRTILESRIPKFAPAPMGLPRDFSQLLATSVIFGGPKKAIQFGVTFQLFGTPNPKFGSQKVSQFWALLTGFPFICGSKFDWTRFGSSLAIAAIAVSNNAGTSSYACSQLPLPGQRHCTGEQCTCQTRADSRTMCGVPKGQGRGRGGRSNCSIGRYHHESNSIWQHVWPCLVFKCSGEWVAFPCGATWKGR